MIDVSRAANKIAELSLLSFFPADKHARTALVSIVCEMSATNEQVDWLVKRCLNLWSKWEGPKELRAVFCSKFRPADAVEVYSDLPQFADGIPSEKEAPALALQAPPRDQRAISGSVSAAPSLEATVRDLARATDLNRELLRISRPLVREIPEVRITGANRITAEDVEREVAKLREAEQAAAATGNS